MKIAIGSDHAGYPLKESVRSMLEGQGVDVVDVGAASEESVDYPEYAAKAAGMVAEG